MAKKKRESKRRKLVCSCGNKFSTHSSKREYCHKCQPKCTRQTIFNRRRRIKPVEEKPKEEDKTTDEQQPESSAPPEQAGA